MNKQEITRFVGRLLASQPTISFDDAKKAFDAELGYVTYSGSAEAYYFRHQLFLQKDYHVFKPGETAEVDNYPYGRDRTTKYFTLDFDKKKGFRSSETTINPKTGKLNKPHKSTYSQIRIMYLSHNEDSDGHIKYFGYSLDSLENVSKVFEMLSVGKLFDCFTKEQLQYIGANALLSARYEASWAARVCPDKVEYIKEVMSDCIEGLVNFYKEPTFEGVNIPFPVREIAELHDDKKLVMLCS